MISKQLRVRPHNDDDALCVVEIWTYDGNYSNLGTEISDEVCMWGDLPETLMRAATKLMEG